MMLVAMLGLIEALIVNLFLLLGPLRGVFTGFLESNQRSMSELQELKGALQDVQSKNLTTISQMADENATFVLADLRKNFEVQTKVFSNQVKDALDAWSFFLVPELGKNLMKESAITHIYFRSPRLESALVRQPDGRVEHTKKVESSDLSPFTQGEVQVVRRIEHEKSPYLMVYVQLPEHDAVLVVMQGVQRQLDDFQGRRENVVQSLTQAFETTTKQLFDKLQLMQDQNRLAGKQVLKSTDDVIIVIALLDVLLICGGGAASYFLARKIIKPVQQLVGAAHELEKGNFRVEIVPRGTDEVATLAIYFKKMSESLQNSFQVQTRLTDFSIRMTSIAELDDFSSALKGILFEEFLMEDLVFALGRSVDSCQWEYFRKQSDRIAVTKIEGKGPFHMVFSQPKIQDKLNSVIQSEMVQKKDCDFFWGWYPVENSGDLAIFLVGFFRQDRSFFLCVGIGHSLGDLSTLQKSQLQTLVSILESTLNRLDANLMKQQADEAQEVQSLLLEQPLYEDQFSLAVRYHQASQGGGDWYYAKQFQEYLVFVIGDVTGHGIPSALLTTYAKGFVSAYCEGLSRSGKLTPDLILTSLNQNLFESTQGKMGMTAFSFVIDLTTGSFVFSNGGHVAPFLIRGLNKNDSLPPGIETSEEHAGNFYERLILSGPMVGYRGNQKYRTKSTFLSPGDAVLLVTDGALEGLDLSGRPFGERRFLKVLSDVSLGKEPFLAQLEKTLLCLFGGSNPEDDVMLALLEFRSFYGNIRHLDNVV